MVVITDYDTSTYTQYCVLDKYTESVSFTLPKYTTIVITLYLSAGTALTSQTEAKFYDIQLEKGSPATSYVTYMKEDNIFIKNNNDVYEKFISSEEFDTIKVKGLIPIGLSFNDAKLEGESTIYFLDGNQEQTSHLLAGFPIGAKKEGTLITINPQNTKYMTWRCTQIYICNYVQNDGLYIRNETGWGKFTGTPVNEIT